MLKGKIRKWIYFFTGRPKNHFAKGHGYRDRWRIWLIFGNQYTHRDTFRYFQEKGVCYEMHISRYCSIVLDRNTPFFSLCPINWWVFLFLSHRSRPPVLIPEWESDGSVPSRTSHQTVDCHPYSLSTHHSSNCQHCATLSICNSLPEGFLWTQTCEAVWQFWGIVLNQQQLGIGWHSRLFTLMALIL